MWMGKDDCQPSGPGTIIRITAHQVEVLWEGETARRYRRAQLHNLRHVKLISAAAEPRCQPLTVSKAPASWEFAWYVRQRNKIKYPVEKWWCSLTYGRTRPRHPGPSGEVFRAMASMDWDDFLRHEAVMYRQLAEKTENVFGKQELLDLAAVCDEVANSIEDRLTGG